MEITFRGRMVAKGPIVKTTLPIQVGAIDPQAMELDRPECTCEHCRNPYSHSPTNPAFREARKTHESRYPGQ